MLKRVRYAVVIIPVVFVIATLVAALIYPGFAATMTSFFVYLMADTGWLICLGVLLFLGFLLFIYIHPIGSIKFGGPEAKPQYTYWNWFAISLCAGIGTGIVFWGGTEPLMIAFNPPASAGLEPGSYQAIIYAMAKCFQHWSFQPYSIYAVPAVICGYAFWNMGKPYQSSSGLCFFKKGELLSRKAATIIDAFVLFAIVGGTAGSLGWGLLQLSSGIQYQFGVPSGPVVWTVLAAVIVTCYTISSATGLDKGIKWLSDKNAWLFIILMILTFVCGPGRYICNLFTESFGHYLNNIISLTSMTEPVTTAVSESALWPQWWDQYWMVDWLSFGCITGLFLVKMAYGRTIREFITINVVLPSMFGIIWFSVFGGFAINLQLTGAYDMVGFLNEMGAEAFMLKLFDFLPASQFLRVAMMVIILLSFVTLADSMTSTISEMSLKNHLSDEKEAPLPIKIFWGILIGITAVVFVTTGQIEGIKIVKTIAGYPMLFLQVAMIFGFLWYHLKGHGKNDDIKYKEHQDKQKEMYKPIDHIKEKPDD